MQDNRKKVEHYLARARDLAAAAAEANGHERTMLLTLAQEYQRMAASLSSDKAGNI